MNTEPPEGSVVRIIKPFEEIAAERGEGDTWWIGTWNFKTTWAELTKDAKSIKIAEWKPLTSMALIEDDKLLELIEIVINTDKRLPALEAELRFNKGLTEQLMEELRYVRNRVFELENKKDD